MKKLMSLVSVLAVASLFAFAGCKKEEAAPAPAEKKAEEAKPAEAPKAEEAKPAEAPKAEEAKPADPAAAPAAADTGVPECNDLLATADKFAKCDKLPKEAKDAQVQAVEAMKAGWAQLKDPNVPAEAKKAAADGCKTANEAMKQAWTAAGCQ